MTETAMPECFWKSLSVQVHKVQRINVTCNKPHIRNGQNGSYAPGELRLMPCRTTVACYKQILLVSLSLSFQNFEWLQNLKPAGQPVTIAAGGLTNGSSPLKTGTSSP